MEKFYTRIFLVCRAPVAAGHSLALNGEFLLLVEFDVHFPEMLAHLARRTAYTHDARYYLQYPDRVQFVLTVSGSIARVVLLPP